MPVKGREPSTFSFVDLTDDDPRHIDAAVLARARRVEGESAWLAVPLRPELKAVSVLRALQTAHFVSVNVELVGDAPRRHLDAPPLFSTAIAAVSHVRLAAPVGVLFPDQDCERCDGVAKLTDAGLEVGGKTWALEEVALGGEIETLARVELAWPGTTEALVRAALIALSHQHVLVVRVAPPSPPPVLPDY